MDIYVARQPIFDKDQNVQAYELLFRSGMENTYPGGDGDVATSKLISNSFHTDGLEDLTKGKKAFINFTRNLIVEGSAKALSPEDLVVEVLETIEPDAEVLDALRDLRGRGYTIALDDFVLEPKFEPLIELADIIKIDFALTKPIARKDIVRKYLHKGIQFLAEKIESHYEFEEAKAIGYTLFQGFFFCEPEIIQGKDIPQYKYVYLNVLGDVSRLELQPQELEAIIYNHPELEKNIPQIAQGLEGDYNQPPLNLKGVLDVRNPTEVKKCIYIQSIFILGRDKPEELCLKSLIRAKFSAYVAKDIEGSEASNNAFVMGLFSSLDVLLGRPMMDVIDGISLDPMVKSALLGEENLLYKIFELVLSYENGEWEQVDRVTQKINLNEIHYPEYYIKSVEWANNLIKAKSR